MSEVMWVVAVKNEHGAENYPRNAGFRDLLGGQVEASFRGQLLSCQESVSVNLCHCDASTEAALRPLVG